MDIITCDGEDMKADVSMCSVLPEFPKPLCYYSKFWMKYLAITENDLI